MLPPRVWQNRRCIIENNLIELIDQPQPSGYTPRGVEFYGGVFLNPEKEDANEVWTYRFPEVVVRGNIIRHIDNAPNTNSAKAISLRGVGQADFLVPEEAESGCVVERNIVGTHDQSLSIEYFRTHEFTTFRNTTPNGGIVRATKSFATDQYPDRETELRKQIEEAEVLSMLLGEI